MRIRNGKNGNWLPLVCTTLALSLLVSCAPSNAQPTADVNAIYTQAFQTLAAQQATMIALTPPTATATTAELPTLAPLPSPSGALPTLAILTTPTAGFVNTGGGTACDSAAFVNDITIPDNTVIDPGKTFTKTWQMMNKGTCTWGTGYNLTFQSGDQMSGASPTAISGSVPPGATVNISVKMTAPTSAGTYKGIWRMTNAASQAFGDTPWVIIKVGSGGPTATAGPSPTAGPTTCPSNVCTITITSDKPDFVVTITNSKNGNSDCVVPAGTSSCSFTVPLHWDGTVTLTKGKWTFDGSPLKLTNVIASGTYNFPAH